MTRPLRSCDWTPDMDRKLLACRITPHDFRFAGGGDIAALAKTLGKTEAALRCRMVKLRGKVGLWTRDGLWTEADDAVIRSRMRTDRPNWREVGARLGRTAAACATRAHALRKAVNER